VPNKDDFNSSFYYYLADIKVNTLLFLCVLSNILDIPCNREKKSNRKSKKKTNQTSLYKKVDQIRDKNAIEDNLVESGLCVRKKSLQEVVCVPCIYLYIYIYTPLSAVWPAKDEGECCLGCE